MNEIRRFDLPTRYDRLGSLCWVGDELVDVVGGMTRYRLDGSIIDSRYSVSYRFDRAVHFAEGDYSIVYATRGTKGLIFKSENIIREINRSFYHANDYEYPIAIFKWFDGRVVIAHCPDEYCRIEIEEIESGEPIVTRQSKSADFFHSRLQTSPDNRYLLSAGWVWQPWDVALIYDLNAVRGNPEILDDNGSGVAGIEAEEISSAAFIDSKRILFYGPNTDGADTKHLLGVHELESGKTIFENQIESCAGPLMPLGDYVVTFFEYPRLIEISTGKTIQQWPEIPSGHQNGSILRGRTTPDPYLAMDPKNRRFAVGTNKRITVVELEHFKV